MSPIGALRSLLDKSLIRLLRYIDVRVHPPQEREDDVVKLVRRRALASSADFVEAHLDQAMLFDKREDLWRYVAGKVQVKGLFAEFGVYAGWSINFLARLFRSRGITLYGFDSFEGLREDWRGTDMAAGHFDRQGKLPAVESNVTLVKGWFEQTLPSFLAAHPGELFSFVHIDADTFETATLVLSLLAGRIARGTVVLFDEYIGFPNWREGEFRAWQEFAARQGLRFHYLGFSVTQAALQVL
jgi:hypothetical protein